MEAIYNRQSGQVFLVALLVMAIASTIALSLIGRTTTNVKISSQIEESAKAFSAAEAGIEEALKSGIAGSTGVGTGVSYSVTEAPIVASDDVFPLSFTKKGNAATLWLTDHNATGGLIEDPSSDFDGGTLDVCFSRDSSPALVVALLYKTSTGSYRVSRVTLDSVNNRGNDFFDGISTGNFCNQPNVNKQTITFAGSCATCFDVTGSDARLALRMRPMYANASLWVQIPSGSTLPAQGKSFTSTGTTATGLNRTVQVTQSYRSPDAIFDYAVYSQAGPFE